ncbi:MAG: hypothetical protein J7480_09845 [Microbacteriaceae bacterium]|nr:hypothetical protein [Microbacteriaceae bacterium]
MTDEQDRDALFDRLRLIEEQPLPARGEAYDAIAGELRTALEAADEHA